MRITQKEQVGEDRYLYYVDYTVNGETYSHIAYKPVNSDNAHLGGTEKRMRIRIIHIISDEEWDRQ